DAGDRADADDAPAALALEGGDGGLDAEEHRLEIEIDDAIPFLLGRFLDRVEPCEAARAVDEDVEATRLADDAIERARDLRGAGRVGGDERGLAAALADRARGDLAGRVVVGGEARARLEAHQRGRMPAGGVATQALHRHAGNRQRLPLRGSGAHDGRTGRLGYGLSLVRANGSVNAHTWASVVG